eukprot:6214321-Pleurochrysis_carterae.AAC.9
MATRTTPSSSLHANGRASKDTMKKAGQPGTLVAGCTVETACEGTASAELNEEHRRNFEENPKKGGGRKESSHRDQETRGSAKARDFIGEQEAKTRQNEKEDEEGTKGVRRDQSNRRADEREGSSVDNLCMRVCACTRASACVCVHA